MANAAEAAIRRPWLTHPCSRLIRRGQKVLRLKILERFKDLPRHLAAREAAVAKFGDDFDREEFAAAVNSSDPDLLNQAKAVERGFEQIFNYIAELNAQGLELAMLREHEEDPNARKDIDRLVDIGVVSSERGGRLEQVRELRMLMTHEYPGLRAGQIHEGVTLLVAEWPGYRRDYERWLKAGFPGAS